MLRTLARSGRSLARPARFYSSETPQANTGSSATRQNKSDSTEAPQANSDSWENKDKNIKHYGAIDNALVEGIVDEKVFTRFWPRLGSSNSATYKSFDLGVGTSHLAHKRTQPARKNDKFKTLGLNPLALWKSPSALSNYITSSGNIIPGYIHGTKGKNQRRLSKAIRRCQAAGLLSTVHRGTNELGK